MVEGQHVIDQSQLIRTHVTPSKEDVLEHTFEAQPIVDMSQLIRNSPSTLSKQVVEGQHVIDQSQLIRTSHVTPPKEDVLGHTVDAQHIDLSQLIRNSPSTLSKQVVEGQHVIDQSQLIRTHVTPPKEDVLGHTVDAQHIDLSQLIRNSPSTLSKQVVEGQHVIDQSQLIRTSHVTPPKEDVLGHTVDAQHIDLSQLIRNTLLTLSKQVVEGQHVIDQSQLIRTSHVTPPKEDVLGHTVDAQHIIDLCQLIRTIRTSHVTPSKEDVFEHTVEAQPIVDMSQLIRNSPSTLSKQVVEGQHVIDQSQLIRTHVIPSKEDVFEHTVEAQPIVDMSQLISTSPATLSKQVVEGQHVIDQNNQWDSNAKLHDRVKKRRRINCPFCNNAVINLQRHLAGGKHGVRKEEAKNAISNLGLRKKYEWFNEPSQRKEPHNEKNILLNQKSKEIKKPYNRPWSNEPSERKEPHNEKNILLNQKSKEIKKPYNRPCSNEPSEVKEPQNENILLNQKKMIKKPYNRPLKICPICNAVLKRLDEHLAKSHHLKRDKQYYRMLQTAEKFIPSTSHALYTNRISEAASQKPTVISNTLSEQPIEEKRPSEKNVHITSSVEDKKLKKLDCVIQSKVSSAEVNFEVQKVYRLRQPSFVEQPTSQHVANLRSPADGINTNFEHDTTGESFVGDISINSEHSEPSDPTWEPDAVQIYSTRDVAETFQLAFELNDLMEQFLSYLKSADSGLVKCDQIVSVVRRIGIVIKVKDIQDYLDDQKIRDIYLGQFCVEKKYLPDSIKTYLVYLNEFYSFLLTRNKELNLDICSSKIITLQQQVTRWIRKYKKSSSERFWERQMEEYEILVDKDQIDRYISSYHCVTAKKLFSELCNSSRSVTWTEYCCMRDNLFVVIELGNAHRSGVCANFTVEEFHRSKFQEGYHMFNVNKHKTMYKYGPAVITLTPIEFEWLSTFVEKVRPQVSPSDENVFLSWTGKKNGGRGC